MNIINKIFFLGSIKRKVILIDPKFQLSIINYVTLLFFAVLVIFYSVNMYFLYTLKQKGIAAGLPANSEYFFFLEDSTRLMNVFFFSSAFMVLILIYYFGLRLSHRIAGPIYKIGITIDEILSKDEAKEIRLRKNDYFKELAAKLNVLIEKKVKSK